ncbi:putative hydrolase of the HAD superfamily [Actinocrispum wychmicini]|uniref:Putative hydrolase of the HAD superfamily n=2 Tax=Actinocrispum wychmicini TaxID=1213861 RepID=A0A4R2JJ72_9PSEU|nr:putative hydrolase of the HAD superfamily [Actinocrispum wychmicini]
MRSGHARTATNRAEIKAVCLDVDDTLVDFTRAARSALFALIGRDDMWPAWQRATDEFVARCVSGELDSTTMRELRTKAFFAEQLGIQLDDHTVTALEARRLTRMCAAWRLFPDVVPCLDWLRAAGLRIAAVTNASGGPQQHAKLADMGITRYFDAVLIAGELGAAKPDPRIFHAACQRLHVQPHQTVHIGDRLDLDAVGARDAGLHGVWLNRDTTDQHPTPPPDIHQIADLEDLPELLVWHYATVPTPRR